MPPKDEQATATNKHDACRQTNRQTNRRDHHNIPFSYRGWTNKIDAELLCTINLMLCKAQFIEHIITRLSLLLMR